MRKQTGTIIIGLFLLCFSSACAQSSAGEQQISDAVMQEGEKQSMDTETETFSLYDLKDGNVYQMTDVPWYSSSEMLGVMLESEEDRVSCEIQEVEISELGIHMTACAEFEKGELIGISFINKEKNPDERIKYCKQAAESLMKLFGEAEETKSDEYGDNLLWRAQDGKQNTFLKLVNENVTEEIQIFIGIETEESPDHEQMISLNDFKDGTCFCYKQIPWYISKEDTEELIGTELEKSSEIAETENYEVVSSVKLVETGTDATLGFQFINESLQMAAVSTEISDSIQKEQLFQQLRGIYGEPETSISSETMERCSWIDESGGTKTILEIIKYKNNDLIEIAVGVIPESYRY